MTVNPEMMRLGRESRGLTQAELADQAELTQGTISKAENDFKDVEDQIVERIAATLRYQTRLFQLDEQYRGFGISVIFYRKRASTLQKHIRRLQAQINILRIQAKALLRDVILDTPNDFQRIDITEFHGTPSDIAAMVRASWKLPAGPIKNLIGSIENAGGIVFKFPFGTTDIDAISQWPNDFAPLFFVNSQAPADRMRFSLAHEIGHMIMHESASETMEHEANEFASALLMPESDIRGHLHGMDIRKALSFKPFWRVSAGAVVRRAHDLGCMSDSRYRSLCMHYTKLGFRQREDLPIAPEEPALIDRLIEAHTQQGGFTVEELARTSYIYEDEFRQQFMRANSRLRLAL